MVIAGKVTGGRVVITTGKVVVDVTAGQIQETA